MRDNPFAGTWRLVSQQYISEEGDVLYPMGPDAIGYLIYAPDGYMSATIMAAERFTWGTADIWDGSDAERAGAAATYMSYAGPYEVREKSVVHQIEVSLFPNWVGRSEERFFEFPGDGTLALSTPPTLRAGKMRSIRATWRKV